MRQLIVVLSLSLCIREATCQIAFWDFENICGPIPCLPIPASFSASGVSWALADMVGGNNSGSPQACNGQETWATNFWPITPYPQEEYLSFVVEALPGYELDVLAFYFSSSASSESSALLYDVYYLVNGTNAIFMGSGQHNPGGCTSHAFPQSIFVPSGGFLEIRLYPYGQSPSGRVATIRLDDVWLEGAVPLPADLLFLRGRSSPGKVTLEWAFGSLEPHAVVGIERWEGSEFREVGSVLAKRHSSTFFWEDTTPLPGENVYRLHVQAPGHKPEIFPPIAVQVELPIRLRSTLVMGASLGVLLPSSSSFVLEIVDMSGRVLWKRDGLSGEIEVPLGSLRQGIYALRYSGAKKHRGILTFLKTNGF